MDIPKLLIASGNHEFIQTMAQHLAGRMELSRCHSGKQALSMICQEKPDLVLMDLMLPEMDGLAVLQAAAAAHVHPQVLVMLDFQSPYILEALGRLQVSYVVMKPCDSTAVLSNLEDMAANLQQNAEPSLPELPDREAIAANVLLELGMLPKWNGFACLQVGIPMFADDFHQSVTKELYPDIGKAVDKRVVQVERNIRSAIQKSWEHGNMAAWRRYFPSTVHGMVAKPSNKAFISQLAKTLYAKNNVRVG